MTVTKEDLEAVLNRPSGAELSCYGGVLEAESWSDETDDWETFFSFSLDDIIRLAIKGLEVGGVSECNTCDFAHWHGAPDLECRRRAPTARARPGYTNTDQPIWPPVKPDDWCGDYVFGGKKHTAYGPPNFGYSSLESE